MRLYELHINNFKFFPKQDPKSPLLRIDGKNLLIYGENGSGKSTIYWAIYTLLESAFKKNEFEVEKYFQKNGEFGLVNIHATKNSAPYIKAVLKDNNGNNLKEYLVNPNLHQIVANMADSSIRESAMASDFLNYRVIFRLHHIKHSKENNLFGWFEDEIFPYILIASISKTQSVSDHYKVLKSGPKKVKDFDEINKMIHPNPTMREHAQEAVRKDYVIYQEFVKSVNKWNSRIGLYLKNITKRANEILKNDFKQNFEIKLVYKGANHAVNPDDNGWKDPEIELSVPIYEGKRKVIKKAHSFLNEAKWSAIGLAIRFAILEDWTNRPISAELKALIIDDLLISLDMSNRDVLLDLLLNKYSNDYQLIFMTHDRFLFELAQYKISTLRQNNWMYLEMFEDENNGNLQPLIIERTNQIKKTWALFHAKELDFAANNLRKATEKLCKAYLTKHERLNADYSCMVLHQMILAFQKKGAANGLDAIKLTKLLEYKDRILNPSSHYDIETPKFKTELEKAIKTVEELANDTGINV